CEEVRKWLRRADRELAPLVEINSRRIQRHCCIPKVTYQLHLFGVIPNVGGHHASRPNRASHLGDSFSRLWHKIEGQCGDGHIKARSIDWECPGIANFEGGE